jgi:hypothetical protein
MSKFDKIFKARETETEKAKENVNKDLVSKKGDGQKKDTAKVKQEVSVAEELPVTPTNSTKSARGRPPAKRSDPDFVGLTTYVRRDTHTRAKIALLQEGKGRELSELVEDLIYNWLSKK